MENELETKDLKRAIPTQQRVNYHQSQIGYQIQSQKLNLSSMDSAATESEYYTTNSSRSQSQNESKTNKTKKLNNKKQQQRRRSISFSSQSSKQTVRSQSSLKSKKRSRTPSPWPQSQQNRYQQRKYNNKKDLNKGISAIQQLTCKYWINGCCNQPTKCQFAHYRFGKIIQEHNKEFSNLQKINQDIRDGLIMAKISLYQLISEEELKNIIRRQDGNMAREIEISYQNSKSYKKMKKTINQIKKNKIMSQNEKKISIREIAYDSIFHLQINNNELNATKRQEAIIKKKTKREEKRVQKQLERQNQNLLQEKIKNLILQQNNASPNQSDDEIYIEEENKDHYDDAPNEQQMIIEKNNNKYTHIINQTNYHDVIDQYSNEIEDSSQQQEISSQQQQNYEGFNVIEEQEDKVQQEATIKQFPTSTQIPQQVLINNYTQNNAALNQLLAQNNNNIEQNKQIKDEQQIKQQEHNKLVQQYVNQMSPPSKKQQTKSNFQFFKELKSKSYKEQSNDIITNPDLMDTTKSVDSQTTKEMELKYALNQLYDWKFICQQKLYTSSTTQNVFNIPNIQTNKYDGQQLISYNTKPKDIDMMDIPNSCKITIKEQIEKDIKNQNIKNLIVIMNKKIAEEIFNAYTVEEIERQVHEYCFLNYNGDKQAKMNDMHAFLLSFAQAIRKVINLNCANQGTEIPLNHGNHMELIPKFCKLETTLLTVIEALNKEEIYKIYIIKQNENPTPFYLKPKQIFN